MSELTDELQYIWSWLKSLNSDFIDCYNPGLNRQQFDKIIKDLPFNLSEGFFQWLRFFLMKEKELRLPML